MESLGRIVAVKNKIALAPRKAVVALHKLIFEEEGDRSNRRRLREFTGFNFAENSEEYRQKIDYAANLSVGDLTSICNILGLDYAGDREQLRVKIIRGLIDLDSLAHQEDETNDEEEDMEDEDGEGSRGEADVRADNARRDVSIDLDNGNEVRNVGERPGVEERLKFALNYKDVEDMIRPYDGTGTCPVERWIVDFEDVAGMFQWNDLQKVIFAKKSLQGLAKQVVQSEGTIKSWNKLKEVLEEEFSKKVTSMQLHRMLEQRKIKKNESVIEYFITMREIAARGSIEAVALFEHVIEGLTDHESNKAILYGATTMRQFKERLEIYEKIRKSNLEKISGPNKGKEETIKDGERSKRFAARRTDPKSGRSEMRCFNCGAKGHASKDCNNKTKGKKCFRCNKYGHVASQCSELESSKSDNASVNVVSTLGNNNVYKEVVIDNVKISSLIDTGSSASFLREDVFKNLDIKKLEKCERVFFGFGRGESKTLGYFRTVVCIDDERFPLTLHVVPCETMPISMIVGRDILEMAELKANKQGVTITAIKDTVFLQCIELSNVKELNIEPLPDPQMRERVRNLIAAYTPKKCESTDIKLKILMKDEKPVYQRPRRLPVIEKEIVEKQVREWIENGIVEPCSSEFASPVVVVKKKDGSSRVCIDYRRINKVIERDRHPLPLIEDQIDGLKDARVFSTLDLKNGFFHVEVDKNSRKYTAFVTHNGQFQFLKAPFGLCNSPPVFQRYINQVFRSLINRGIVLIYMDDIIILAKDEEEAIERLELVLRVAGAYGLELNIKKCRFMKRRIEFLGQIIENGKVYPSDNKVKAVMQYSEPKSMKDVQCFLGLTGYFRKFIENYSIIARPLSDLLRKNKQFEFNEKERHAFNKLKEMLIKEPVLKIFNSRHETELHTDACQDGFGAVLLQRSPDDGVFHPVYFASHKTTPAERNYKSYELEVLAIIYALKRFRVYLLGIKFKIVTDCAAFNQTMRKKEISAKIWRWAALLEDFDYDIEHRPGTRMKHVDAMSRCPVMSVVQEDLITRIKKAQQDDEELRAIVGTARDKSNSSYCMREGLLHKYVNGIDLLVIPGPLQTEIIRSAHEKGHFAVERTKDVIKRDYYIPDLRTKIEKFIANCIPCIIGNRKGGKQEGYLHPISKGDTPLHTYHIDHLGPLESTSKKYNYILAVIDSFTKFVWLYPTKSTTAREVIDKMEAQKQIFGNPARIISDRGTAFSSQEFQLYCRDEGIAHVMITTGLPRSNGQVERLNRTIISVLTKLTLEDPTKWYQHVRRLQLTLNSTYQRSIGLTPFQLLTGVQMRQKEDLQLKRAIEDEFRAQFEKTRDTLRMQAKEQLIKTQEENRRTYNLRRRVPARYEVGDLVAIKRTQLGPGRKLRAKYIGPYQVERVKCNNAYDVKRQGSGEGPLRTSTCVEYIKPWAAVGQSSGSNDWSE